MPKWFERAPVWTVYSAYFFALVATVFLLSWALGLGVEDYL